MWHTGSFILHFRGLWGRLWLSRWAKRNLKSIRRRWPSAPGLTSFKCILNIVDFDLGAWNSKYTLLLKTCGQIDRGRWGKQEKKQVWVQLSFHWISIAGPLHLQRESSSKVKFKKNVCTACVKNSVRVRTWQPRAVCSRKQQMKECVTRSKLQSSARRFSRLIGH